MRCREDKRGVGGSIERRRIMMMIRRRWMDRVRRFRTFGDENRGRDRKETTEKQTKYHININLLTGSFIHSLTHWLIHSLVHLLKVSFTHSLAHSLTISFTHWLIHSLAHSLTNSFTHSLAHSQARSLTHSLAHSLTLTHISRNLEEMSDSCYVGV